MAQIPPPPPPPSSDPRSGFCAETKTFHSLQPPAPFPPQNLPLSYPAYAFSLLPSPLPSNRALIDTTTASSLSFPELVTRVRSLASSLSHVYGLSHGHVAFVLSPSSLEIPVLYLALLSIGAVVSPSNPACTLSEISRQCRLVSPTVAFATSSTAPNLPRHLPTILLDSPDFQNLIATKPSVPSPAADVLQSDTAAILFSSGTTGEVKGVELTHRNLIAEVAPFAAAPPRAAPEAGMITVPLFHVFGFVTILKAAAVGETVVVQTERFDARKMLGAVRRFGLTNISMAPPALRAMVRAHEEDGGPYDVSSLEVVRCGGAPIGVDLIRRFVRRFPKVRFGQGYGLTESTAGIFRAVSPEESRCLGSAGRLVFGCEAKIVDPITGNALSTCKQGELWVRGPVIMKGYINNEEATSSVLDSDGWLKTGDMCYIDNDGFLFVVDRLKELIKYKGYQVPPAELENLLQTHTDVIEAAVIPYPDEEVGQIPMAFIVRQPNSILTEAEIIEFVAKQVAPYKRIRRVAFVKSIPKNAAGKILRKDLTALATSGRRTKL